jgi:hypothetical protein
MAYTKEERKIIEAEAQKTIQKYWKRILPKTGSLVKSNAK